RSLTGARIGVRALPVDRKTTTVPDPLVTADLDLAADVRRDLPAKVTLDLEVRFDVFAELQNVFISDVLGPDVGADPGSSQDLKAAGSADAEDVGERDL